MEAAANLCDGGAASALANTETAAYAADMAPKEENAAEDAAALAQSTAESDPTAGSLKPPVTLFTLYKLFFFVGLFSFGGGMTAWFHREVVIMRGWLTNTDFASGYAMCQLMPGVNSTNMVLYLGQRLRGGRGAIVSMLGMLTAPFCIVIAAAYTYSRLIELPGFSLVMAGVGTAAIGLLLRLGITIAQGLRRTVASYIAAAITFVAVGFLHLPILPVILVLAPISIWAAWPRKDSRNDPDA